MPDPNKFQALTDAHYKVKRTCLRCVHFVKGHGMWGTCRQITYEHAKHTPTETPRQVSVTVDGWCPHHAIFVAEIGRASCRERVSDYV